MKKIITFFFIGTFISSNGQQLLHCGTDEMMKKEFELHPEVYQKFLEREAVAAKQDAFDFQHGYKNISGKSSSPNTNATVYIIPVVFHVLHQNGAENISDAQIYDQMAILNRDYRKLNADTSVIVPAFQALASDVEIEFRLATLDSNGNCTNGITRHYDVNTDWSGVISNYAYTWPRDKYMNVYVVRSMQSGVAGYTFTPGLTGPKSDAIVVLSSYIGSIGTSSVNTSRTLTHEVGHWFNLLHVWGTSNNPGVACGNDNVSDTPITKGYSTCPLSNCKICNAAIEENVQNYMEYSYCSVMFTAGQVTRMRNAAGGSIAGRNNLWTAANLTATGVNPVGGYCAPIAEFSSDKNFACVNANVTFTDKSWNGHPASWNWSFPGGVPSASTDSIPVINYSIPGLYPVTLSVSNGIGADSITKNSFIKIASTTATYQTGWSESFETSAIPNADWDIVSNDTVVKWTRTDSAAVTGTYSMYLKNTANSGLEKDDAISPSVSIGGLTNAGMSFKLAFAQTNSSQKDYLRIYSSINCGQTWTLKYSKTGSTLQTLGAGVYQTTPFVPTASQWRTESINIGSLVTQTNVTWKFQFICDSTTAGNNIYIDDINLFANVGIDNELENTINFYVAPNPSNGQSTLNFNLVNKMPVKIEVSDMLGRKIETVANSNYNPGEYKLNIGEKVNYSRGIYFVNLQVGGKIFSQKIIVE